MDVIILDSHEAPTESLLLDERRKQSKIIMKPFVIKIFAILNLYAVFVLLKL